MPTPSPAPPPAAARPDLPSAADADARRPPPAGRAPGPAVGRRPRHHLGRGPRPAGRAAAGPDRHPVDQPAGPARTRDGRGAPDRRRAAGRGPGARDHRARSRPRHGHRPPPRRRHRRRAAAPAVAPRRRARRPGALDARSVRGRCRGRLRLGSRGGRHEGHGRDGDAGAGPPGPSRPRRRPDPASDPIPGLRRDVLFTLQRRRGGRWRRRRQWLVANTAGHAPGGRRPQRGRRRLDGAGGQALLPDPGGREGLRGLPDHRPRHVGPRLHATRRQRRRHGRRGRSAAWPSPASRG